MDQNEMQNEVIEETTNQEVPEGAAPISVTQVVTYKYTDVVDILTTLNEKTPVVGIDAMRNIVKVFDILNNGTPQQAYMDEQTGEIIDPSMIQFGNPIQGVPVEESIMETPEEQVSDVIDQAENLSESEDVNNAE